MGSTKAQGSFPSSICIFQEREQFWHLPARSWPHFHPFPSIHPSQATVSLRPGAWPRQSWMELPQGLEPLAPPGLKPGYDH